jgi:hypothetical protein
MICFECGKKIDKISEALMIGVDIPYINLLFHISECKDKVFQEGEEEYLQRNKEKIFRWAKEGR